ncbi:hypothetical protein ACFYNL_18810 [Streptomyces sp. NPDC007808]|uniref:hypothetical protein n=1 Tax=Streptomyces sp. NPDC007808 TaxID=3364779 RepID=UPI0036AE47A6
MRTRITVAVLAAASAVALAGCNSEDATTADKPSAQTTSHAPGTSGAPDTGARTPGTGYASAVTGIPPEPTGAARAGLLRALAAANQDIVKHEDEAVDAARNQCSAINGGGRKLDRSAAQRFTYEDVTTTEAQGKQINEALKGLGFCEG